MHCDSFEFLGATILKTIIDAPICKARPLSLGRSLMPCELPRPFRDGTPTAADDRLREKTNRKLVQ